MSISLLIVDDDIHAVEGIKTTTDWAGLGVATVYTAYSMKQAQQVLEGNPVDIMLCDIKMPKGSGLDLLQWVREQGRDVENIFLTSHASFTYARQAISLDSMDYLLKPVSRDNLETALRRSVDKVHDKWRRQEKLELAQYWSDVESQHMRQFWLGVINESVTPSRTHITQKAQEMHVPLGPDDRFLPVLVRAHKQQHQMEVPRSVLNETVSAIGRETIFPKAPPMLLPYDKSHLVILDAWDNQLDTRREDIINRCAVLRDACENQGGIRISCYAGEYVAAWELAGEVARLIGWRREHVTEESAIYTRYKKQPQAVYVRPPIAEWMLALGGEHSGQIIEQANRYLDGLAERQGLSLEVLARFFQDFMQELYVAAHKKQILANLLMEDENYTEAYQRVITSVDSMKRWVAFAVQKVEGYISAVEGGDKVVNRLQQYIRENISEELGREHLARQAFLNPEYLSRLFRRQTGMSLSDYIANERITAAKKLLLTTALPIGDIALQTGYNNAAYFSKIFKRLAGQTPQQYRNQ